MRATAQEAGRLLCPMRAAGDGGICEGPACMAWSWLQASVEVWRVPQGYEPTVEGSRRIGQRDGNQLWAVPRPPAERVGFCGMTRAGGGEGELPFARPADPARLRPVGSMEAR